MRQKETEIHFRVSVDAKNQLLHRAKMSGKTTSQFLLDAAFAADQNHINPKGAAAEEVQAKILNLLRDNQKMQYIIARLILRVGAEQLHSVDEIMKYFRQCQQDADEKFGEG